MLNLNNNIPAKLDSHLEFRMLEETRVKMEILQPRINAQKFFGIIHYFEQL